MGNALCVITCKGIDNIDLWVIALTFDELVEHLGYVLFHCVLVDTHILTVF